MSKLSERIKDLRKEKNLTQTELAEQLGVKLGTVSTWERAISVPEFETLDDLCSFFDVDLGYLMGSTDKRNHFHLTEEEQEQLGRWAVEDEQTEYASKFAKLDFFGKSAVEALIDAELKRCIETRTLCDISKLKIAIYYENPSKADKA